MSQGTLLGVRLSQSSLQQAVVRCRSVIDSRSGQLAVACANPHSLVVSTKDAAFRDALKDADMVLPDGVGVTVTGRLLGRGLGPRITGIDFFNAVLQSMEDRGCGRIAFFGSKPEVLDRIVVHLAARYPHVEVVAAIAPPYGDWSERENEQFIVNLNASRPDVVWVGMTAPRQEKWVLRNRSRIRAPVIASVGAVFDYCAGTVQRAPDWICRLGLEWLYRLAGEPRRLWRRTVISAPQFLWLAVLDAVPKRGPAD
jgi:N-acetylglucosaminyldiphosphoundecaprenol N-acetyl-beta-D-mannosaminyltransferase